uniref:Cytochrome b561 domain-containing protein n=1 Tax=Eptatretus burgeri TaxID=7764 RepID=A0A8C4RCZ3_EPTBU
MKKEEIVLEISFVTKQNKKLRHTVPTSLSRCARNPNSNFILASTTIKYLSLLTLDLWRSEPVKIVFSWRLWGECNMHAIPIGLPSLFCFVLLCGHQDTQWNGHCGNERPGYRVPRPRFFYRCMDAALMVTVWLGLVSFGILVARFYRFAWSTQQLCSQKVWFQMHRTAMVMAFVLTIVAVSLAFVYRGGWSTVAGVHAYLGIIVVVLVVIQPIMALFRPHPEAPKVLHLVMKMSLLCSRRYIFNWVHWAVGMSAWILAVATVFLGVDVRTLDLPDPVDAVPVAGLVLWHILIEVVLEVYNRIKHHPGWLTRFWNNQQSAPMKGSKFHTVLLVMYILGLLAFLLYFYTLIARF